MRVLIRYTYPGTVNDRPVGDVYVLSIAYLGVRDGYSYAKDPAKATAFSPSLAAALVRRSEKRGTWPGARVVPADTAEVLA